MHVAVEQAATLGGIGRAKRSWVVGFDHVNGSTEALCVALHTSPPVGDWKVRAPGDEEMIRGGCCLRSPATVMEGKLAAMGGSHKLFCCLTNRLIITAIHLMLPWCSQLPKWNALFRWQLVCMCLSLTTKNLCALAPSTR